MSVENVTPGTPAQGETGTPAAAPSGGTPAATPASGTPAAPAASGTPAAQRFEYQEDRSTWVPPHRIRETSARAQQLERDLHYERQRVAALSGVQPPQAPEDAETQAIRQQLDRMYPGLSKLISKAERLEQLAEMDPQEMNGAQEHYWQALGQQTLNRLDEEVSTLLGGGDLSPFAKRSMHSAFSAFVQGDRELAARYAAQDPKLIKDFIKEYQQGFVDPLRRTITAQQAPRQERAARLPRGGNSSAIPGSGPQRPSPADTDEYHNAAFRSMTQSRQ